MVYAGRHEIYDRSMENKMRQVRNWKRKKRETTGFIKLRRGYEEILSMLLRV